MEDPFLLDQSSLEQKLQHLQQQFERWRRLRDLIGQPEFSVHEEEFDWLSSEIALGLKNAGWDLDDLEETLKLMKETGQATAAGQSARHQFLQNSRRMLQQLSAEMRVRPDASGDSELPQDLYVEEPPNLDLLGPQETYVSWKRKVGDSVSSLRSLREFREYDRGCLCRCAAGRSRCILALVLTLVLVLMLVLALTVALKMQRSSNSTKAAR